jgi:hypothetical protein
MSRETPELIVAVSGSLVSRRATAIAADLARDPTGAAAQRRMDTGRLL